MAGSSDNVGPREPEEPRESSLPVPRAPSTTELPAKSGEHEPEGHGAFEAAELEASAEGAMIRQITASLFAGPMPPPAAVRAYEDLYPGATKFFFDYVKEERDHRHKREFRVVNWRIALSVMGVVFAFLIAAGAITGAVILGLKGQQWAASVLGAITAIVAVFVYGSQGMNLPKLPGGRGTGKLTPPSNPNDQQ